ncbi:hypothetical protein LEP3755_57750 [Leptolyngbya sp. NIES-3755]|nr:hypothetical protein LEP3755_57750 [Leptolyngbya sp. NIES-3755]
MGRLTLPRLEMHDRHSKPLIVAEVAYILGLEFTSRLTIVRYFQGIIDV